LAWNLVAADYATDIVPIFSKYAEKAVTMPIQLSKPG
jgi:hypothetical protein